MDKLSQYDKDRLEQDRENELQKLYKDESPESFDINGYKKRKDENLH